MGRKLRDCLRIGLSCLLLLLLVGFNSSAQLSNPSIRFIEWNPKGDVIAVTDGDTVVILSTEFELIQTLYGKPPIPNHAGLDFFALSWSSDGHYLATSFFENQTNDKQAIVIWETNTWDEVLRLDNTVAFAMAWSPESLFFTNGAATYDISTGDIVGSLSRTSSSIINTAAWSPTNDILVYNGRTIFFNPFTYELLTENPFDGTSDFQPVFSPNGSHVALVSYREGYKIDIIDITSFQVERSYPLSYEPSLIDPLTWIAADELAINIPSIGTRVIDPTRNSTPIVFETSNTVTAWSPDGDSYLTYDGSRSEGDLIYQHIDRSSGDVIAQISIGDFQASNHFEIFDTSTFLPIASLNSGDTINTDILTNDTVINAKMSPETVGSVIFDLNGASSIDNTFPYTVPVPSIGAYTLIGTPYRETDGQGEVGASLTIEFSVTE